MSKKIDLGMELFGPHLSQSGGGRRRPAPTAPSIPTASSRWARARPSRRPSRDAVDGCHDLHRGCDRSAWRAGLVSSSIRPMTGRWPKGAGDAGGEGWRRDDRRHHRRGRLPDVGGRSGGWRATDTRQCSACHAFQCRVLREAQAELRRHRCVGHHRHPCRQP